MILNKLYNSVLIRIALAKEPIDITLDEFWDMMLSEEWITIFSEKVNGGGPMRRRLKSVPGPSGNVKYEYWDDYGYMILDSAKGFRTIDVFSVTKCIFRGQTYYIK